jgi:hypothetical protein
MIEDAARMGESQHPAWLQLLQKPYEGLLGSKSAWDLRLPDGTAVQIERGGQGLNNTVYRVRVGSDVYACKVCVVDERQRARREWTALVALQAAGLQTAAEPIVFAPDGPLPQPVIACRWVSGSSLMAQALDDRDLAMLICELEAIHGTPPPPGIEPLVAWGQPSGYAVYLAEIQSSLDKVCRWAAAAGTDLGRLPNWVADLPARLPLFEQVAAGAQATVAQAGSDGTYPVKALVRLDGNPDNIVRDGTGQFVFIDWEYSGWGDAAYDLAELRWHPRNLQISQQRWENTLAGYRPHPDDPGFRARLAVYSQLVPAHWVGRSAVHLLEGAGLIGGRPRLARVPVRMYRAVRKQLDNYLATLGLIDPPEAEDVDGE